MDINFVFNVNTFVADIFSAIKLILDNYTQNAYQALRDALEAPLAAAITLYYVIMGVSITYGWVEISMRNLVKSVLKVGLIYSFTMNWDFFTHYFITIVSSAIDTVSNTVMGIAYSQYQTKTDIGHGIQSVLNNVWNIAEEYWKQASFTDPLPLLQGTAELILGCAVLVTASGYLLVTQAILALLFGLAPLIVAFMLFKSTEQLFMRWLGEISAQAMAIIFVSAALGMVLVMMSWVFPPHTDISNINPAEILGIIFVSLISLNILRQAAHLGRVIGMGAMMFADLDALSLAAKSGKNIISTARQAGRIGKSIVSGRGKDKRGVVNNSTRENQPINATLIWWRNRKM